MNNIDYNSIPPSYPLCFHGTCPLAATCLRHLAGEHLPADAVWGPAVYPTALKDGQCKMYHKTRVIHAAYGFDTLFHDVKKRDDTPLRDSLKSYLGGHGTYYRYNRGERLLTPEQQAAILDLFRSYGYTENLAFDHYRDVYDFG